MRTATLNHVFVAANAVNSVTLMVVVDPYPEACLWRLHTNGSQRRPIILTQELNCRQTMDQLRA